MNLSHPLQMAGFSSIDQDRQVDSESMHGALLPTDRSETSNDKAEPRPAGLCVHKLVQHFRLDTLTGPRRQVENAPPRRTDSEWLAKPPST